MNEGHSAFLVLELIRERVAAGLSFAEAREQVREQTVIHDTYAGTGWP
jgi:glycogen phosphorylase